MKNLPAIVTTYTRPATIANRITRAHNRHTLPALPTIHLQAVCTSAQSDILQTADRIVSKTLHYLASKGNPIPAQIERNRARDNLMHKYAEMWERADEYRMAYTTARDTADLYAHLADTISEDAEQRAYALYERDCARMERDQQRIHADTAERRLMGMTHSDRADLVQVACVAIMTHGENSTMTSAAVREAVRKAGSINGYTSTATEILRPATAEDITSHTTWTYTDRKTGEQKRVFEPLPHIGRHGTQDGTEHIEHRKAGTWRDGTPRAEGLYIIHRRYTAPIYQSFEAWTENGGTVIEQNDGINSIQNQTDRADIERLIDRAGLTPAERIALLYFISNLTRAEILKCADEKGLTDTQLTTLCWKSALRRAGITTNQGQTAKTIWGKTARACVHAMTDTERKRFQRLRDKLRTAREAIKAEDD